MKGALDVVLRHCTTLPNGTILTDADRELYESKGRELGHRGLRGMSSPFSLTHTHTHTLTLITSAQSTHTHSHSSPLPNPHTHTPVVAMASGFDLTQLSFVGMMGMWDPPREWVDYSIQRLKESGVSVKMITGDAKETAEAIGEYAVGVA